MAIKMPLAGQGQAYTAPGPAAGAMPSWLAPIMSSFGPQQQTPATSWANPAPPQAQASPMQAAMFRGGYNNGNYYQGGGPGVAATSLGLTKQQQQMSKWDAGMQASMRSIGAMSGGGRGGVGGYGGSGGPNGGIGQSVLDAQNAANAANQQRYQQLLGLTGQLSNAQEQRELRARNMQMGQISAQMASRGLGNSTIGPSLQNQALDYSQTRMNEIGDQGIRNAMGVIERRTDLGPDASAFAAMAARPGASGMVGAGGGYGVGPMMMGGSPGSRLMGSGFGASLARANASASQQGMVPGGGANWGPSLGGGYGGMSTVGGGGYHPNPFQTGDMSEGAWSDYQFDPNAIY